MLHMTEMVALCTEIRSQFPRKTLRGDDFPLVDEAHEIPSWMNQ